MNRCSLLLLPVLIASALPASAQELWGEHTTSKDCGAQAVYVGPNRPELYGGICLHYDRGVFAMHTSYTIDKNCEPDGVYVGPHQPAVHGGYCLWLKGRKLRTTYTTDKNCQPGGVYAGPDNAREHGGYCVYIVQ